MNKDSKIYIAGHAGLVGSAIHRKLVSEGYNNIIYKFSCDLDLRNKFNVNDFFYREKPEYVFMAAAKVGGVKSLDTYRADSIYSNLLIQTNVIHACYESNVKKLLFLGSNCLYPKLAVEPLKEEYLMSGKLETTTESYAVAKIAGIKMCQAYNKQYGCNFINVLPVNLYGQGDTYDLDKSHVMPALIMKFHEAKLSNSPAVEIWGSGRQKREFMHVDDLADACLFLMINYNDTEPINVGTGENISILDLALIIKEIVGYEGELYFNTEKPEGINSKLLDINKISKLGWKYSIELREGIKRTYEAFKNIG